MEFKNIGRDSIVYGIAGFFGKGLSFLLLPIYTTVFSPADYGMLEMINVISSFLGLIVSLGLDSSLSYYYFKEKDIRERSLMTSTIVYFKVINALVVISLSVLVFKLINGFFFDDQLAFKYYMIAVLCIGFQEFISLVLTMYRLEFKSWHYLWVTLIHAVLSVGFGLILILIFNLGVFGYFLGNLVGSIIAVMIFLKGITRYLRFSTECLKWLKRLLTFGLPMLPASICTYFLYLSDRWFINHYLTFQLVGVYSVASQFSVLFSSLIIIFSQAFSPYSFKYLSEENEDKRNTFFELTFRYYFGFSCVLVVCIFALSEFLVKMLVSDDYYAAGSVIGYLVLSAVYFGGTYFSCLGTWKSERTYLYSIGVVVAMVLGQFLNYFLVPVYGIRGAAIATLGGMLCLFFLSLYLSHISYKIKFTYAVLVVQNIIILVTVAGQLVIHDKGTLSIMQFFAICFLIASTIRKKEAMRIYYGLVS